MRHWTIVLAFSIPFLLAGDVLGQDHTDHMTSEGSEEEAVRAAILDYV